MKISFSNIPIFIKKYFLSLTSNKVKVYIKNNVINVEGSNFIFGINTNGVLNNIFYFDSRLKYVKDSTINLYAKKMLFILNSKFNVPISVKLKKNINNFSRKDVFILGNNGDINNFSNSDLNLLSFVTKIYTNNINGLKNILDQLGSNTIEVKSFTDIYIDNLSLDDSIVLFQYGDIISAGSEIYKINSYLKEFHRKIYIHTYYSSFINNYVLSHSNYGSLFYSGTYNIKLFNTEKDIIIKEIYNFINYTKHFICSSLLEGEGKMLSKTSYSIQFKDKLILNKFIKILNQIKDINLFNIEIIYENTDGYINKIGKFNNLILDDINNEENISNISVFIYRFPYISKLNNFIGYDKIVSDKCKKQFVFLSAPISSIDQFTNKTLKEIKQSKYIFGETLESIENFFKRLKINYDDKIIYYADDSILLKEYIKKFIIGKSKENYGVNSEFIYIPDILPELIKLLNDGEKIYYITDGGTPCILDPGDSIKKYINLFYPEYGIFSVKGPSIIPTILLSCVFDYKNIFWAPLIYTIQPGQKEFLEVNFFDKNKFINTLVIFYSFGQNFFNDLETIKNLFDSDLCIQIIGDVGTNIEYNKVFKFNDIEQEEISYIHNKLSDVVYLLKYY